MSKTVKNIQLIGVVLFMDGSPQRFNTYIPLLGESGLSLKRLDPELGKLRIAAQSGFQRLRATAGAYIPARDHAASGIRQTTSLLTAVPNTLAAWLAARPTRLLRAVKLPSLSRTTSGSSASAQVDTSLKVIGDFEKLDCDQQDRVAKNLALLWDNFQDVFGGVSGFRSAPLTEQKFYMERLEAAAQRMEAARESDAAFHYVTVELMRHYVAFLQTGSTNERAVVLARLAAPLIDRGRRMTDEPVVYRVKS